MKKIGSRAGYLLLTVPTLLAVGLGAEAQRTPSIRAVMHKQYRVTRAPFILIKKELDVDDAGLGEGWRGGQGFLGPGGGAGKERAQVGRSGFVEAVHGAPHRRREGDGRRGRASTIARPYRLSIGGWRRRAMPATARIGRRAGSDHRVYGRLPV